MLLVSTLCLVFALPTQSPDSKLQSILDALVEDNQGSGGGIARVGVDRDGVLWEGASGNRKRNGYPIAATDNYEIASTSKAFTAAALLLMVEDGLLDLDAPIGTYLPPSQLHGLMVFQGVDYSAQLTLRQLIQHTSGLPDYWYDGPYVLGSYNAFLIEYSRHPHMAWTPREVLAYVPNLDPIFIPGTDWHYGDSGFVIAGIIMQNIDGKALHEIYHDRIFQPLGMQHTWLHWRETAPFGISQSHRYEGGYNMFTKRQNSADWSAGGLVSTAADMQIFMQSLASGNLFRNAQTLHEMTSWVDTGEDGIQYGLGVYRVNLGFGLGSIWGHDGYGNSWMYYWPRHGITFSGTLNQTENDWWPFVLGAAVLIEYF